MQFDCQLSGPIEKLGVLQRLGVIELRLDCLESVSLSSRHSSGAVDEEDLLGLRILPHVYRTATARNELVVERFTRFLDGDVVDAERAGPAQFAPLNHRRGI